MNQLPPNKRLFPDSDDPLAEIYARILLMSALNDAMADLKKCQERQARKAEKKARLAAQKDPQKTKKN